MTEKFNVRSEILAAIAKTETTETKTLLLLMLGVLEEIGGKIDAFLQDEKTLRDKVLNGHEPSHHKHHDWIEAQMKAQAETEKAKKSILQKFFEGVSGNIGALLAAGVIGWLIARVLP